MRIGIFSECYNPVLNGVVVSINAFQKELQKRGHEYYIFTTDCLGGAAKEDKVFRYSIMLPFKPKGGKYPIAWPQNAKKIAKNAAKLNLDLIHSQHLLGMGYTGLKVAKDLKIPSILTYHTLLAEYTHYSPVFPGLIRKYLINKSRDYCNKYDQIITPSPSMAKVLRTYGVTVPIESIATGVNLDDYQHPYSREEIAEKWQIPPDKKILLYVSRVAKEKNVGFLFDAIRQLAAKRQDFHLLMIGGGPELPFYQAKIKEWKIDTLVTFTDMLEKKETNRHFGAGDIFIFASVTETQGIVITEAMAAGVPAVAVNQMGPSDIIKNGEDGYLTALNLAEFTGKIEKLLDDENLRNAMGQKARENAQEYSNTASADKMEKLYTEVLGRSNQN